jgi:CDP-diacylglycerol--serine O-phosphatidyltransferase
MRIADCRDHRPALLRSSLEGIVDLIQLSSGGREVTPERTVVTDRRRRSVLKVTVDERRRRADRVVPDSTETPGPPVPDLSLVRQLTLANLVTTASLVVGLAALLETTVTGLRLPSARLRLVFALIVVAAILDAVDGPIARRLRTAGVFGGTLDSLADVVSFGVVPATVAYFSVLHRIPIAGAVSAAAFCTCAAWRLARFQLCGHNPWFLGCPVPLAAVILGLVATVDPTTGGTLIAICVLSALMVGTVPFPSWDALNLIGRRRAPTAEPVQEPVGGILAEIANGNGQH